MKNHSFSKIWIIGILAVVLAGGFFAWHKFGAPKEGVKDETAGWKTYKSEEYGFEIKYPEGIVKKYIGTQIWPPKITINLVDPNFVCEELQQIKTSSGYGNQKEVMVNNHKYCVITGTEGAAGTFYTTYKYIIDKDGKQLNLEFILRFSNCGAASNDAKVKECEKEEKNFNPTELVDQILSTFRFLK